MERTPKALIVLTWVTSAVFVVALYLVLIWAPQEAIMGDVQRVFYFHVAAGWVGALAFLVTAIVGGIYLARGEQRWDRIAVSSVEIGIIFTFINIVTGSIWARPIWNTWWTWDPRLVTATIMLLIYIAYIDFPLNPHLSHDPPHCGWQLRSHRGGRIQYDRGYAGGILLQSIHIHIDLYHLALASPAAAELDGEDRGAQANCPLVLRKSENHSSSHPSE
jgi:ABC-type transport system involved in cytochrome c biogenesis permease subunit